MIYGQTKLQFIKFNELVLILTMTCFYMDTQEYGYMTNQEVPISMGKRFKRSIVFGGKGKKNDNSTPLSSRTYKKSKTQVQQFSHSLFIERKKNGVQLRRVWWFLSKSTTVSVIPRHRKRNANGLEVSREKIRGVRHVKWRVDGSEGPIIQ